MPLIETKGAASAQGFGLTLSSGAVTYIEDVFSTYLYTGNGSTQTITNGIDLSGKGGLVWTKGRSTANDHYLFDTTRGGTQILQSNNTLGQFTYAGDTISFLSNGWSTGNSNFNQSSQTYVSGTFREQPKFFDVVTYTGNGANRTISHSLGSVPGCIIIKRTDTTGAWAVYHRSLANTEYLVLNTTAAKATGATYWNSTTPTSTVFSLGTATDVNANTGTYVAYLFAHDAGGFGLSGTDNVISCGSYTGNGSATGPTITLGYEPQWLMIKNASGTGNWNIIDNMRGMPVGSADAFLEANTSDAEATADWVSPTATGFNIVSTSSEVNTNTSTYIYIAIRRGPMRVPTDATKVFDLYKASGSFSGTIPTNFAPDFGFDAQTSATHDTGARTRLIGDPVLITNGTNAEASPGYYAWDGTGGQARVTSAYPNSPIFWMLGRAPGFADVVCYTGTGSNTTQTHNLGVVPELIIVKRRDTTGAWDTYSAALSNTEYLVVNTTAAKATGATRWNSTTPTSTVFSLGTSTTTNASGGTYVAYLFATCAGVSKVGSYTGTGTTLQVDCGFTGGARFVLIKRTDNTGDWYVWDSARGIVSGNDPYLLLNSNAAEVTNTDYVDTYSAGFEISSTAPAAINANGGTYIFLAIA